MQEVGDVEVSLRASICLLVDGLSREECVVLLLGEDRLDL
jgi:hypothetical protein